MAARISGFSLIIGATVITGIAGYAVTWLVRREIGAEGYALFAVFWAALYLVVGGLSGIQQETTRATFRISPGTVRHGSRSRNFGVVGAVVVFGVVVVSSPLWAHAVFGDAAQWLIWPLAVGAASYVLVATLCGSLYGISQWRSLSLMIAADGVFRLAILGTSLLFTDDIVVLAWTVALPFPLTIIALWPVIRGGLVNRSDIDVGYRALSWNVARTVLASVSTAVLVSGFPLLIGIVGRDDDQGTVGDLIFTITLTRAPLIVTVMALQGYLLVRFRDGASTASAMLVRVLGVIAVGGAAVAVLGWWFGPQVFEWVVGEPVGFDGGFIAILVGSSVLVAALSAVAAALLARSQHRAYSIGWAVAAIATIAVCFLPIDFLPRIAAALLVGPVAGLAVHVGFLLAARPTTAIGSKS